jgi:nitrate/nitrite transporter NarK
MNSPALTIAVITVTACSIFAALPVFWTVPSRFLVGAAAAAGIALINTMGNLAGFAAGYATGWLKDLTGDYYVPMFVVGGSMLFSGILMVAISSRTHVKDFGPVTHDDEVALSRPEGEAPRCPMPAPSR